MEAMKDLEHNPLGQTIMGYLIVSAVQFPNPADWYLWRVIGKQGMAYVVWTYNIQTDGFAHGHYFGSPDTNNHHLACRELACWYTEQLRYVYGANWKSKAEATL